MWMWRLSDFRLMNNREESHQTAVVKAFLKLPG